MRAATPRTAASVPRSPPACARPVGSRARERFRRLLQREIAGGKGIGMAEAEQQEDIRGPGPIPLTATSARCASSAISAPRPQFEAVLGDRLRERAQGAHLGRRQAAAAQRVVVDGDQALGDERDQAGLEPRENRLGARGRHLLRNDDAGEPLEPGGRRRSGGAPPTARTGATNSGSLPDQAPRPRPRRARFVGR